MTCKRSVRELLCAHRFAPSFKNLCPWKAENYHRFPGAVTGRTRNELGLEHVLMIERRLAMNWDQVAGNWKQFKGNVKQRWGKLTDQDLTAIEGKREQLIGKLQERYGIAKEEAEAELKRFSDEVRM
jgi:uncharacterized protein YjbJ (UPF0337 family)